MALKDPSDIVFRDDPFRKHKLWRNFPAHDQGTCMLEIKVLALPPAPFWKQIPRIIYVGKALQNHQVQLLTN